MPSNARADASSRSSQVNSVNATASGLVKATVGAAVTAGAILTFVWLPAEYGIDPTGVGHVLGLTEMGHIKEQLHAEADADAAAAQQTTTVQPTPGVVALNQKMDAMQVQLTDIASTLETISQAPVAQADAQPKAIVQADAQQETGAQADSITLPAATWLNELEYTLAPGEGIEVKLVMDEGSVAQFEWSANGSVLNYDTHGDGNGQNISYEKGRSVPAQVGQLTAAFTGNHGWFWRNRTDEDVVVSLRTKGDYKDIKQP